MNNNSPDTSPKLNLWQKISRSGLTSDLSHDFSKRLILTNQIHALGFITVWTYMIIFLLIDYTFLATVEFFGGLAFLASIWANTQKKYTFSRLALVVIPDLILATLNQEMGLQSGMHLFLYAMLPIPFVIFEIRERGLMFGGALFTTAVLLTTYVLPLEIATRKPIPVAWELPLTLLCAVSTAAIIILIIMFLATLSDQNENALRNSLGTISAQNKELAETKDQLEEAFHELKAREEELIQNTEELQTTNDHLSATKLDLESALADVKEAQAHLVASEKMASLGQLVAGVAHEINTPVGVAVTAASHLESATQTFIESVKSGAMNKNDLVKFIKTAEESSRILLKNLERAAELVQSFKKVAVNQTNEETQDFYLKNYLAEVMISLSPNLRRTKLTYRIDVPDELIIRSLPSVFSQILINFVTNAIRYAYEPEQDGELVIKAEAVDNQLFFIFSDDGKGVPEEIINKIFDPFVTTGRSIGGSGLGLNIVFNLVTQKLKGEIRCESKVGDGAAFIIKMPLIYGEKSRDMELANETIVQHS